ncbi:M20/M25/M40 family metallo-hydrolase [Haladaptatus salinisoli]|uniref:M20/M25/M40 family metallo-hydrolase n=1 Tax=Haladaptatus salinisoli TaxID=2884876 RepID=UPI001D0A5485|nr:M20/M25/M40 family metallo-hydrolase [Haladaptatus salinisoli]
MTEFDPISFLERAVGTESHESVDEMRTLLVETLDSAGAEPRVDDAGNVLAERGDADGGPRVVLNTHVDTVPPHVPFSRDGDVIRGRGSCDAKGPLAALLAAFLAVEPARGSVTLAVTPDEETNSTGAAALDVDADAVVVGEPTGLDVCNAARGRFQATVTLRGENAHAANPEDGVNAVGALSPALEALSTFDSGDEHPELGAPTLTPTTVEGGTATNQVPAECLFVVDRRSVPPEGAEEFRAALESHLREAAPPEVDATVALAERDTPFLEAFETPADSRLVRTLRDAGGGEVRPFGAATEASYFARVAPTVVFGPGVLADDEGAVAHGPREYVRTDEVETAADAVTETLRKLLA